MSPKRKLVCPACTRRKLILRQINLTEAVYLCEDKKCSYPEGFDWILVPRTLDQLYIDSQKRKQKKKKVNARISDETHGLCSDGTFLKSEFDSLIETEIKKLKDDNTSVDFDFDEGVFGMFDTSISNLWTSFQAEGEMSENLRSETFNDFENLSLFVEKSEIKNEDNVTDSTLDELLNLNDNKFTQLFETNDIKCEGNDVKVSIDTSIDNKNVKQEKSITVLSNHLFANST